MSDTNDANEETPTTDELEAPSTEKAPGEEPKAARPHDPEPDHEAVGIGIPGRPQVGLDGADDENEDA
jgi:hypothetical protein